MAGRLAGKICTSLNQARLRECHIVKTYAEQNNSFTHMEGSKNPLVLGLSV